MCVVSGNRRSRSGSEMPARTDGCFHCVTYRGVFLDTFFSELLTHRQKQELLLISFNMTLNEEAAQNCKFRLRKTHRPGKKTGGLTCCDTDVWKHVFVFIDKKSQMCGEHHVQMFSVTVAA